MRKIVLTMVLSKQISPFHTFLIPVEGFVAIRNHTHSKLLDIGPSKPIGTLAHLPDFFDPNN